MSEKNYQIDFLLEQENGSAGWYRFNASIIPEILDTSTYEKRKEIFYMLVKDYMDNNNIEGEVRKIESK